MVAGFSEEDIRRVREANDIVELFSERTSIQQRGKDFWCCCPFHQEKTPSCKIDAVRQTWHCFGCGEGGDIISYIRKLDDVDFVDAVRFLARRANIELQETTFVACAHSQKARLKEICKETADFYHTILMRSADLQACAAREYLSSRMLGGSIPKEWHLGFAPGHKRLVSHLSSLGFKPEEMIEANVALRGQGGLNDRFFNRVMFPIRDIRGEVIAFGGRVVGQGEPKYLNSGETPIFHKSEVLYGLDKAKVAMASTGDAIIVEGYTDVIALHEAGFSNAVATLGTALTRQHIRLLAHHAKSRIVYLFDGDEAGQRAADRALSFIDDSITPEAGRAKIDLCAVTLPDNLDPADFLAKYGKEVFGEVLEQAVPLIRFGIDRRLARFNLSTPEGKSRAIVEALSILAPIKDSLLAKDYAVYIAGKVHAREQDILDKLAALKPSVVPEQQSRNHVQPAKPRVVLTSAEKNRLKTEREFLSLCAQNPAMTPDFYDALAGTLWHEKVHAYLAEVIMDIISVNPSITVVELLDAAALRHQYARKVLTSSVIEGHGSAYDSLRYLADELRIGDLEAAIAEMRDELKMLDNSLVEERTMLFQSIIALQNDLNALRLNHTVSNV